MGFDAQPWPHLMLGGCSASLACTGSPCPAVRDLLSPNPRGPTAKSEKVSERRGCSHFLPCSDPQTQELEIFSPRRDCL